MKSKCKAGKRGVFPTHPCQIPGKIAFVFFIFCAFLPYMHCDKSFSCGKRQKEGTPLLNLQAGVK
jgi:hypothetical protein